MCCENQEESITVCYSWRSIPRPAKVLHIGLSFPSTKVLSSCDIMDDVNFPDNLRFKDLDYVTVLESGSEADVVLSVA